MFSPWRIAGALIAVIVIGLFNRISSTLERRTSTICSLKAESIPFAVFGEMQWHRECFGDKIEVCSTLTQNNVALSQHGSWYPDKTLLKSYRPTHASASAVIRIEERCQRGQDLFAG